MAANVSVGLLVTIQAKDGKEADVESFLESGRELVDEELDTIAWFALKIGPSTYGIFDAFPDNSGRDAHLNGKVAAALMESVGDLIEDPKIEKVDVIATKLPG